MTRSAEFGYVMLDERSGYVVGMIGNAIHVSAFMMDAARTTIAGDRVVMGFAAQQGHHLRIVPYREEKPQ